MTRNAALTPKQKRFVEEYLLDLNATQAAVRAGYSEKTCHVQGPRLLGNVSVAAAIKERMAELSEKTGISHEWVIERLQAVHDASMERTNSGGTANPAAANRSLELIGKHGGMWQEGHVSGDINIQVNVQPWKETE